jgi:hypothetical protein
MNRNGSRWFPRRPIVAAAAAAMLAFSSATMADPGYYVVTVYDEPGVRTVDFRYWTVKFPASPEVVWPEVGLGWNPTGRWYTEILASYVGSSQFATALSTLEWQNDFLLTQGQYPFDFAIHTLISRPQSPASGTLLEIGPALQTDIVRTQINFNLGFEKGYGALSGSPAQLKYQWQIRHRWRPWLHFGAQGFGELGPATHWAAQAEQSHRAGPALFGQVPLGGSSLSWQAAYLVGKVYATQGHMFTMRAKLDF